VGAWFKFLVRGPLLASRARPPARLLLLVVGCSPRVCADLPHQVIVGGLPGQSRPGTAASLVGLARVLTTQLVSPLAQSEGQPLPASGRPRLPGWLSQVGRSDARR